MNRHIDEIIEEVGLDISAGAGSISVTQDDLEYFAEKIIEHCLGVLDEVNYEHAKHDVNNSGVIEECYHEIEKYFGLK